MLHWDKSIRDSKKVEENVIYVNARYVYNLCPDVTQIFFNYYGRIHFNYKANKLYIYAFTECAKVSLCSRKFLYLRNLCIIFF